MEMAWPVAVEVPRRDWNMEISEKRRREDEDDGTHVELLDDEGDGREEVLLAEGDEENVRCDRGVYEQSM